MKTVRNIYFFLSVAVSASVLYSCGKTEAKEPGEDEGAVAAAPLEVIELKSGGFASELKVPGELVPYQQVDLYAKVSSFVKKLYADVGSVVQEGALLATLEAPEYESQLAGAESRLKAQEAIHISSKANYDRLLESSRTPGTVSPNDLDQAQAKQQSDAAMLESAKAGFREIKDTRGYLEIRAPFSGVVSARNVSAGAYVGPSGKGSELPLFTLLDQQRLRLVVSVPEAYTRYVDRKTAAQFTVRSLPGQKFEAGVSRLSGALDSKLRSQRAELDVYNKDKVLLPGMVAEVLIPLATSESSLSVPVTAVLNAPLGLFVIKIQNGAAAWVPVTTGRNNGAHVEILGDLQAGDQLVLHANEEIRDRAAVAKVKVAGE